MLATAIAALIVLSTTAEAAYMKDQQEDYDSYEHEKGEYYQESSYESPYADQEETDEPSYQSPYAGQEYKRHMDDMTGMGQAGMGQADMGQKGMYQKGMYQKGMGGMSGMGHQTGMYQKGNGTKNETGTGQDDIVKNLAEAMILITKRLLKEDGGKMAPTKETKYPTKGSKYQTKEQTNSYDENRYGGDAYSEEQSYTTEPPMKYKQSMMRPTYKQSRKPRSAYRPN